MEKVSKISKPANVTFDLENLSDEDIDIKLGNISDADYYPTTQYIFTTPYKILYEAGTKFGLTVNGILYEHAIHVTKTPTQIADILTLVGAGTFQIDSSVSKGNIFYVSSNTNVFTTMIIS